MEFADEMAMDGKCYPAPPELRLAFKKHLYLVADAMKAIEWNDSGDGAKSEQELIEKVLNKQG